MLIVSDAGEAVQWYEQGLGAKVLRDLNGVAGLHLAGAPLRNLAKPRFGP